MQLVEGYNAGFYSRRPFHDELEKCSAYFRKSYLPDVSPGTNTEFGLRAEIDRATSSTTTSGTALVFSPPMRGTPTVTFYARDGTVGVAQFNTVSAGFGEAAVSQFFASACGVHSWFNGSASGLTANQAVLKAYHFTADAEIYGS